MNKHDKTPRHVAIIMDGNGRWAKEQGKERSAGHIRGVESVRTVLKAAREKGIEVLTLYTFSTENWNRPAEEVETLMDIFTKSVLAEIGELKRQGVKVRVIGDRTRLSETVRNSLDRIESETVGNDGICLLLAFNYSSRDEIATAVRQLCQQVVGGKLKPTEIDEIKFSQCLYTSDVPDPDLIIRTGGEYRLSNFLLWQGAYSELYFTDAYWPEFGQKEFNEALEEYARRERRFGRI